LNTSKGYQGQRPCLVRQANALVERVFVKSNRKLPFGD
jgi:hypothetical protein